MINLKIVMKLKTIKIITLNKRKYRKGFVVQNVIWFLQVNLITMRILKKKRNNRHKRLIKYINFVSCWFQHLILFFRKFKRYQKLNRILKIFIFLLKISKMSCKLKQINCKIKFKNWKFLNFLNRINCH